MEVDPGLGGLEAGALVLGLVEGPDELPGVVALVPRHVGPAGDHLGHFDQIFDQSH